MKRPLAYITAPWGADEMENTEDAAGYCRIEIDILNNFKHLGVTATSLNGADRLRLLHDILRMDAPEPFRFSWDWLALLVSRQD